VYGFPKRQAAEIAIGVMREHESRFERIVACVFDAETEALYRRTLGGDRL
jgi:O-acetyl-ADP-ribose deacetylase (regulator of RNase III)